MLDGYRSVGPFWRPAADPPLNFALAPIPRVREFTVRGDQLVDDTLLTRQDWRGAQAGWTPTSLGHWEVDVRRAGAYEVTLRFAKLNRPGTIRFALGERKLQREVPAGATTATFHQVRLARGVGRLESWVTQDEHDELDDRRIGMLDVVVKHVR